MIKKKYYDALDIDNSFLGGSNIRDSMGCALKPTFYTTIINSDFDLVSKLDVVGWLYFYFLYQFDKKLSKRWSWITHSNSHYME